MYSQLILFLAPSFMLDMKNAISVNSNFSSALQTSSDLLQDCNDIIGYSFIGITLSYLANIFLFILQGISPGFYYHKLIMQLFILHH